MSQRGEPPIASQPGDANLDDAPERALDKGTMFPASDRLRAISTKRQRIVATIGDKPGELAGVHVLVVDDDPDALAMMHASLAYVGALVTAVPSVRQAFEALNRITPNVIVSDLRMSEEDGVSFARRLQAVPSRRWRSLPTNRSTSATS